VSEIEPELGELISGDWGDRAGSDISESEIAGEDEDRF
jgi:hypothetical protein